MRPLILLALLPALFSISYAQEIKLKDIPENHWAEASVYKLINEGVTSGFPDGTFRGLNLMSRQEMAVMLSNFSKQGEDLSDISRTIEEFKSEVSIIKYKNENPNSPKFNCSLSTTMLVGNLGLAQNHGPKLNYRLNLSLSESIGHMGDIKLGIDTLDSGFGGGTNDLSTKMFYFIGNIDMKNSSLTASVGPGDIFHRETDQVDYSDDYTVFVNPKNSLSLQTQIGRLAASIGISSVAESLSQASPLSEISGSLAYTNDSLPLFGKTTISVTPKQIFTSQESDSLCDVEIIASPSNILDSKIILSSGTGKTNSSLYAKGVVSLNLPNTSIKLSIQKSGSLYRKPIDKYEFETLNEFNKVVLDGTSDVGIVFTQNLSSSLLMTIKSDASLTSNFKLGKDYPGTSLTTEFSFGKHLNTNSLASVFYRSYLVPSGISSKDPALAVVVPEISNIFGINFSLMI